MSPLRKLPLMTADEIDELLGEQALCRIAFRGPEYPYVAPFQYVFVDGHLYFHFTNYGRKIKLMARDDRACVEVERVHPDLSVFDFVSVRGRLEVVEDPSTVERVVRALVSRSTTGYSKRFLAAHGLSADMMWEDFTAETSSVVVRLGHVSERVGIKSPRE